MENGRIKDDKIYATSSHVESSSARFARLNSEKGAGAWCHASIERNQRDQYLQVRPYEIIQKSDRGYCHSLA